MNFNGLFGHKDNKHIRETPAVRISPDAQRSLPEHREALEREKTRQNKELKLWAEHQKIMQKIRQAQNRNNQAEANRFRIFLNQKNEEILENQRGREDLFPE